MGRPRTPWQISFDEVRRRYESGESAQSLATECGLETYKPVISALRGIGVRIRRPGSGRRPIRESSKQSRVCKGIECDATFDAYPSSNKRFCSPKCRYSSPELADLLAANIRNRHCLTEIDEASRTALCSVCGPIDIRERIEQRKFASEKRSWRCRGAERARIWARKYGLDRAEIGALWESQGRRCAICRTAFASRFVVDHCHATGATRGLLCSNCNTALGLFADEAERLRAAASYLDRARSAAGDRPVGCGTALPATRRVTERRALPRVSQYQEPGASTPEAPER
ncbi:endonuclease VII domain-containing protein [Kitasatospora sp. NPDC091335]|uniref:endonuclease VII domain-containing protein n=1 Tax=Kitasatospora sp. NPDC091335 TaxID=3364085 RepID=UPI003813DFCD